MATRQLTEGDDIFLDGPGGNTILALGGNDHVRGRGGNDTLNGGLGDDELFGNIGNDRLIDHDGSDGRAEGGDGADFIQVFTDGAAFGSGGRGNDHIEVSSEFGRAVGGAGSDFIRGSFDGGILEGGEGGDVIDMGIGEDAGEAAGGSGDDRVTATGSNGFIRGEVGNDSLTWREGVNNTLAGGDGNDFIAGSISSQDDLGEIFDRPEELWGGNGNDTVNGRAGQDHIIGGPGRDAINAGIGDGHADSIDFNAVFESRPGNVDVVRGFGQEDVFDLSGMDANTALAGNQEFAFIGNAAFTATGQVRSATIGEGVQIVQANNNAALGPDFAFRVEGSDFAFADVDFIL